MNLSRRHCLGALALSPVLVGSGLSAAVTRPNRRAAARGLYTFETAPDRASKLALLRPLRRLTDGLLPGENPAQAIHRNFPSLIERNFARLTPAQLAVWFDGVEERSLSALAQSYLNTTEFVGREPLALQVLAQRLDPVRLAGLARYFGAPRVQEAILRAAPGKVDVFNPIANYNVLGPRAPDTQPMLLRGGGGELQNMLDYTIYEIYLAFRTAPIGATSVAASLYQTSVYAIPHLAGAWGFGYAAGSLLALGMQTYTPSLWDRLVDGIGAWLELLNQPSQLPPDSYKSPEEQSGIKQRDGYLYAFELGPERYDDFAVYGGDYEATQEWADAVPYEPFPSAPICGPLEDSCGEIHPLRLRLRGAAK
jgi:hypothetical protein